MPDLTGRLQQKMGEQVRKLAPVKLCQLLPEFVDKDINKHLKQLPSQVSISEILEMFKEVVVPLVKAKLACPASCSAGAKPKRQISAECRECGKVSETVEMAKSFGKSLDLKKLDKVDFDYGLLYTKASARDLIINLRGEFSPPGRRTPFRPFATKFPQAEGTRMAEALFTDFTLNSLLYWLHEVKFLNISLDNTTPTVGEILKTTCGEEDGGDFPSVEVGSVLNVLKVEHPIPGFRCATPFERERTLVGF